MAIIGWGGMTFFIIAGLVILIWIIIGIKKMRHKIFAILLIALILLLYLNPSFIFRGQDIDFKSISGIQTVTKLSLSWLGSLFSSLKSITTNAIKLDWKGNSTTG